MNRTVTSPLGHRRGFVLTLGGLLVVAAWAGSFGGPFVFDDIAAVRENLTLRDWWKFSELLAPPAGLSVSGRPVANASLAVSYALSGEQPWGYHAVNLALHLATAGLLVGVVRRTLRQPRLLEKFGAAGDEIALAVAAVWSLHPLQTATVTYVMQRTEGLAGFFAMTTLYCFLRGVEIERGGRGWRVCAIVACALGMGSKEVMVVVPMVVFLYDRTWVAGNFAAAWRARKFFYSGLGATWLVLVVCLLAKGRNGSAGWDAGMSVTSYALTQAEAIWCYLRLAVWPAPLVFDYGAELSVNYAAVAGVVALIGATAWAWVRRPLLGCLGFLFFAALAPSSSFVPVATQTIAEHRMYLPLAVLVTAVVLSGYAWIGKRSLWLWALVALAGGVGTWVRNLDYRSERAIWADTVAKRPGNARAHFNLGVAMSAGGDDAGARTEWTETLRIEPTHVGARAKMAESLAQDGRAEEALRYFEAAAQGGRSDGVFMNNWGSALLSTGRTAAAMEKFMAAQARLPKSAQVQFNVGNALVALGRGAEAIEAFRAAVRLLPEYWEAHYNLGVALSGAGEYAAALAEFEAALRLAPGDESTRRNVTLLRAYLSK
jgi:Tfp pilus assembly protein PilF